MNFHRLLEQNLLPGLRQAYAHIEQIIPAIGDAGCVRHFFRHYEDGRIKGDAGRSYRVTKNRKEIVSALHRNFDGCSGRTTGLRDFFLTELFDTFICCLALEDPDIRVSESET